MIVVVVTTGAVIRATLQLNHNHQHPALYMMDGAAALAFATCRRAPNLNRIPCVTEEDECLSMRLTMKSVISRRSIHAVAASDRWCGY